MANADNPNQWALFDLQFDPAPLLEADDATLLAAIDGEAKAIRRISINAQPPLLPLDFAPEDVRGGRLSDETYHLRAQIIRSHGQFRERVARLLAGRYGDRLPSIHVEERIYDGFASNEDQVLMDKFHRSDWPVRSELLANLQDDRFREIGQRIFVVERPDLVSTDERQRWDAWRHERIFGNGELPWLTIPSARTEIAQLLDDAAPAQRQQLAEIECFLNARMQPKPL